MRGVSNTATATSTFGGTTAAATISSHSSSLGRQQQQQKQPQPQQLDLAMVEWEDPLASHRSSQSVGNKFKALFSDDEDDDDHHSHPPLSWNHNKINNNTITSHHNYLPHGPSSGSGSNKTSNQQQPLHYNPIMPSLAAMTHTSSGFVDPLLTSTAYHIHQAESALSSLKQIIWEYDYHNHHQHNNNGTTTTTVTTTNGTGWKKTLKHKKSGVVVHMKNGGVHKADKTPTFKGEAVIHGFSPQSVFYVIGMRKLWDEQYEDGNLVENLNETTSLTYEVAKPNPTSSLCANSINRPRDMALVEKIECTQDGAIFFACTSVETPRVPRIQGRVRAQIKLQGWVLQPIHHHGSNTPATRVIYVIQENMKGWVPGFAKKSLARRPLVIALVNEYLQKKAERMRLQKMRSTTSNHAATVGATTASGSSSASSTPFASMSNASITTGSRFQSTRRPSLLANSTVSARSNHSARYPSSLVQQQQSKSTPSPSSSQRSSSATTNGTLKKRITFAEQDTTYSASPLFETTMDPSSTSSLSNMSGDSSINTSVVNNKKQQQPTIPLPISTSSMTLPMVVRPHPLYPVHRYLSEKVESMNLFKRLSASLDPWTLVEENPKDDEEGEENNDFRIYSYNCQQLTTSSSPRLPLIRADGFIIGKWSAEQLCSAVQCFGARKTWDDHFEEGHIIDRFSQKDYLVHWAMQNQQRVLESTIAITSIETDPVSGVITTVTTSVHDNNQHPTNNNQSSLVQQQHIRESSHGTAAAQTLQVDLYGWIFRPGDDGVHITWISNLATSSHCIPRLTSYMNHYGCPPYIRRVAGKVIFEDFNNELGTYRVVYIAKHEQQKKKNHRLWCTDIRIHASRYPAGIQVTLTPSHGTRADLSSSMASIRVYTTLQELDGEEVTIDIAPTTICEGEKEGDMKQTFTCNGQPMVPRLAIAAAAAAANTTAGDAAATATLANIQSPPIAAAAAATVSPPLSQQQQQQPTPTTALSDSPPSTSSIAVVDEQEQLDPPMVTPPQSAGIQTTKENDDTLYEDTLSPPIQQQKEQEASLQKENIPVEQNHIPKHIHKKESEQSFTSQSPHVEKHEQPSPPPSTLTIPLKSTPRPSTPPHHQHHHSHLHHNSIKHPLSSKSTRLLHVVPEGYKLIPQHQNNNIIIISDELTFNGQQLAVVFLAMVLSYYMGKLACASTYC
ncbi:hypothetical protein BDA99DRAFT_564014 [Phascolomyces articulosus]|uniref:START domain-containing protein n=1 Tax=Phascolomyces articulosus TaxID=60185 RepID=A0AAD5K1E1_9FUNG|nr:hypothetical protein BDA99DRAFT_564014 [Phascolomyces articulosus]